MPELNKILAARLQELVRTAPHVVRNPGGGFATGADVTVALGWCLSAVTIVSTAVPDPSHPYRKAADECFRIRNSDPITAAMSLYGQLCQLQADFEAGLLANFESQISAQTFDDVLDHAAAYLADKRHEPAGVLAGVIFEDTVRKLCDKHGIPQDGNKLDSLLSELAKAGVVTALERKEATAAAAVRTSATHARWSEYGLDQVDAVVRFTRRLVRDKLAV